MDVDANDSVFTINDGPETGDSLPLFDVSPEHFAWRSLEPIRARRTALSGQLIFDILLIQGGLRDPASIYPPVDADGLQQLLEAIESSKFDTLKKECLVYYLLRCEDDEAKAAVYRDKRGIPPHFIALANAYWHLDVGDNLAHAVSLLSDARINKEYTSKIMRILALAPEPGPLILKYVRTAKPTLRDDVDVDAYATALIERSLMEAWTFQRTFPSSSSTRRRVITKIVDWCLIPSPRKTPLTHLMAFPFNSYEQTVVHDYAVSPPSHLSATAITLLQDLVCVRLIHAGQYAAAVKLDRQFTRGADPSSAAAQDRRKMMNDIQASLPDVERRLLHADLDKLGEPSTSGSMLNGNAGLSMSWENLRPHAGGYVSPRPPQPHASRRKSLSTSHPQIPLTPSARGGARNLIRSVNPTIRSAAAASVAPSIPHSPAAFGLPTPNGRAAPVPTGGQARNAFFNPPLITTPQPHPTTSSPSAFAFASSTNGAAMAKNTRNPFATPLRPVNGNRVPSPSPPRHDVDMEAEEVVLTSEKDTDQSRDFLGEEVEVSPAEYSMFTGSTLPPGTLPPDEPAEDATSRRKLPRRHAAPPKRTPTLVAAEPQGQPEEALNTRRRKRTLPGGFGDDDLEEDELEDIVPPLPSSTAAISKGSSTGGTVPRKSRRTSASSRAGSAEPEQPLAPVRVTRRSSRLSAEPPSPEVPTRTKRGTRSATTRRKK